MQTSIPLQKIQLKHYKAHPENPRIDIKSLPDFYESLKYSFQLYGYVDPIIVNKQTNHIISGHQRVKILLEQGQEEVDAIVLDISPDDEKLLLLALNKITGKWQYPKLGRLLKQIEARIDITRLGFDDGMLAVLTEQSAIQKSIIKKRGQTLEQANGQTINGRIGNYSFKVDPNVYQKFLKALKHKKPEDILKDGIAKFKQDKYW